MRLAFAYDQLYPETIGGAQRYYWALTRELAGDLAVSYLTIKRWSGPSVLERDGVEIVGIGAGTSPLAWGTALARHLTRHGGRYDIVHCACFPPGAAPLARAALLPHRRTRFIVDWHEVLTRTSWRRIRGRSADLRWWLQRLAVRHADAAVTFSALHERRLREEGRRGLIVRTPEFLPGDEPPAELTTGPREPLLVFLGRLIGDKRAHLVPPALAELRRSDAAWRAIIFGDGPERERVSQAAQDAGVGEAVEFAGFAYWDEISQTLARAGALLLPTEREGFGLVVLEAAAHGVPTVLVDEPDNAATELIDPGVNGLVCPTADPRALAAAVLGLARPEQPARTRAWYEEAARHYSVQAAANAHRALYERLAEAS